MAKSGKHVAPRKKAGAHLKPKDKAKAKKELEPKAKSVSVSEAESEEAKKLDLNEVKTDSEKSTKSPAKPQKKEKKKKRKLNAKERIVRGIGILAVLVFCVFMITPLKSCVLGDDGYVGEKAAENTAIADSGVKSGDVETLVTDMIRLDGEPCYKIEFTSNVNGYKYIVNAESGEIVAQSFFSVNNTETEE